MLDCGEPLSPFKDVCLPSSNQFDVLLESNPERASRVSSLYFIASPQVRFTDSLSPSTPLLSGKYTVVTLRFTRCVTIMHVNFKDFAF